MDSRTNYVYKSIGKIIYGEKEEEIRCINVQKRKDIWMDGRKNYIYKCIEKKEMHDKRRNYVHKSI